MEEETFLLASLEDKKAKDLAQILSNETARKILNYLTKKEATETQLSKELNMPLPTIHYNVQQLLKNEIIQSKHFVYSEKGKEVNIYSLAKKLIIIAPKSSFNIKEQLKKLIPVFLIMAFITFIINIFSKKFAQTDQVEEKLLMAVAESSQITQQQNLLFSWENFILGALIALIIYLVWGIVRKNNY